MMKRKVLIVLGILHFFWCFLPVFAGIFNIGSLTGMVVGALLVLYGAAPQLFTSLPWQLQTVIKLIVLVIAALTVSITAVMVSAILQPAAEADTVIVLGCKVDRNGPSRMLRERLDAAYDYLQENTDAIVIVTGGQGSDEPEPEGTAMQKYLVKKGIDAGRIYVEDKSESTRENLINAESIMEENRLSAPVLIVTNEFHVLRARMIANSLSIEASTLPAPTDLFFFGAYYIRELYGVLYQIVF
ncbi:YdcF family protein [Galactobacillus timonensis]|uniref:YdcF family protein n=1 Tax=Galactobacillus timonensis TaxID=2041840 RepID=UPI0024091581|nr:YdcF family protein [Galactobacillus timonensis]MDD6369133.1 YdcF family protein [Galactobacillus timonensis]